MKLIVGLDYELFFGKPVGTVEQCMLRPTEQTASLLESKGARLCLFVDAGYLLALKREQKKFRALQKDYDRVCSQLADLSKRGHDIQLHIHPHWEDSYYDEQGWQLNLDRYRLHDFSQAEVGELVVSYKNELELHAEDKVFAYRAGGWCIQPFEHIRSALKNADVWLDSTVYENGHSEDEKRWYQFGALPDKAWWRFDNDPCEENDEGYFVELPISALPVGPSFYWAMVFGKKLMRSRYGAFGDGAAMTANSAYYRRRLTRSGWDVASVDGFKSTILQKALHKERQRGHGMLNLIGHPKAMCPDSLRNLQKLFDANPSLKGTTFSRYASEEILRK